MGATAALMVHGRPEQKKMFVPKMGGQWTGTMNLTEPQCAPIWPVAHQAAKQADAVTRSRHQDLHFGRRA